MLLGSILGLFMIACSPAHAPHTDYGYDYYHISRDENPTVHKMYGSLWIYVAGHRYKGKYIPGHWEPIDDPSYIHNYMWVEGKYTGRGKKRYWVPGHWRRIR